MPKKNIKKKTVKRKAAKKKAIKKKNIKIDEVPRSKTEIKPRLGCDEIEYIKALLIVNPSISEVARITRRTRNTVRRIRDINEDELTSYRHLKSKEFIKKAWDKIELLLGQLTKGKCLFASVNQITTAIGTLYDKAALASGDVTDRVEIHKYGENQLSKLTVDELKNLKDLLLKTNE